MRATEWMTAAGVFASEKKPAGSHHIVPLVRAPNGAPVIGFAGWSGSGKTTLVTQVVAALTAKGWNIAVVKHAHHMSDIDHPGKDSWRHRHAGARQVVVASPRRWAVIHENQAGEPMLSELLAALQPCDLVLVEGYKRATIPKVEVWRGETFGPPLWSEDAWVFAVATTPDLRAKLSCNRLMLPLENPDAIAMAVIDLVSGGTIGVKTEAIFTR